MRHEKPFFGGFMNRKRVFITIIAFAFTSGVYGQYVGTSTSSNSGSLSHQGTLGIGVDTPASGVKLHVRSANDSTITQIESTNATSAGQAFLRVLGDGGASVDLKSHGSARTVQRFGQTLAGWTELLGWSGNGLLIGTQADKPLILGTNATARFKIDGAGQVSVNGLPPGTQATDAFVVNGKIRGTDVVATFQDVAEWVPVDEELPPGTVVIIDRTRTNTVIAGASEYDTRVAGVVSSRPGILLGIEGPSKAMIATTGRVLVRVDASRRPIERGDLLVSSGRSGMAMRSEPIDVAGVKIHRPGTVIGKALEPLAHGEGEILVLLSLQ
jgi:hypothetical protein